MPLRDAIHGIVKQALIKDGWIIKDTDDPYVISYGERFLFVDLGASKSVDQSIQGSFIGAEKNNKRIAIEIKEFRGCLKSQKIYAKPLSKPLPYKGRGFETPLPL